MTALREHIFGRRVGADRMFRWRGAEVSRLEGLSDGVFALTITLLVVSVQVPNTFFELWQSFRELPVFLVCFVLLMWAWRSHYLFFRRYGLEDLPTIVLNGVFLFLVLFYAYPIKFVATFLWHMIIGVDVRPLFAVPEGVAFASSYGQRGDMMLLYGVGFMGVFGSLALLSAWAYHRRAELELDALELHLTRASIVSGLITVAIAILSLLTVLITGRPDFGGIVYFLMGPAHGVWGYRSGARARRIELAMAGDARPG